MKRLSVLLLVGVLFFAPTLVAHGEEMPLVIQELLEQIEVLSGQLLELGELGARLGGAEMERVFAEQIEHFERMQAGMEEGLHEAHGREHGADHGGHGRREWGSLGRSLKLTFERKGGGDAISLSCAGGGFSFARHNEERTSEGAEGVSTETGAIVSLEVEGEIVPTDKSGRYLVRLRWEEAHHGDTGEAGEDVGTESMNEYSTIFSGSALVQLGERVVLFEDGPRSVSLVVTEQ